MVILLLLERLFELWLSQRNVRRLRARGGYEVASLHTRVMMAVHALFLASCALERKARPLRAAWLGVAAAQALRYFAVFSLGERWNVRVMALPGQPPIRRGPYRLMRHPNYLAVAVELFCFPLALGARRTALAFSLANAALFAVRIPIEERALHA